MLRFPVAKVTKRPLITQVNLRPFFTGLYRSVSPYNGFRWCGVFWINMKYSDTQTDAVIRLNHSWYTIEVPRTFYAVHNYAYDTSLISSLWRDADLYNMIVTVCRYRLILSSFQRRSIKRYRLSVNVGKDWSMWPGGVPSDAREYIA